MIPLQSQILSVVLEQRRGGLGNKLHDTTVLEVSV